MAKLKSPQATPDPERTAEAYTVVARRYRPQQFEDLVGQEPVIRSLVNALAANRVAHAYLFTGARGVGKTSTARILAKALDCVNGPTAHPCDVCDICKGIAAGEDVDVLEIDGASNRGIDNVRELRSSVQYRPSRARYKIYIIDEVHMLSKEAFNALLKTLEEPPPHVKFIFATTEVQKIPITILSRCQRFDFAGIGIQAIVERLKEVVQQEGMQADDEALELVARRAGGSMRDAQSLLDQLLAFGGDRLTADQVHALLGTAQEERVLALVRAVLSRDMQAALKQLAEVADQGVQLGELLDQLIGCWRDLMMIRCAGKDAPGLNAAPRHRALLVELAESLSMDSILAGLDVLASARARMRFSSHTRTLFEMALVRLGRLEDLVSLAQLSQWLSGDRQGKEPARRPAASAPSSAPDPVASSGRLPVSGETAQGEGAKKKHLNDAPAANASHISSADSAESAIPIKLNEHSLAEIWREVLKQVSPMLGGNLQKATPAISGPNTLVLRFPGEYNHQKEFCQEPERLGRVEEAVSKIIKSRCQVRVESAGGKATAAAEAQPAAAPQPKPAANNDKRKARERVQQIPLLKSAMDVLDAQIVNIEDDFGSSATAATGDAPTDSEEN
jgi:DNA polymerase-3 subunit gamma/tau